MTATDSPATFAELGLDPVLVKGLDRMEIHVPSEIQVAMIPPILEGRDVVGQARTGTGKTLAFALPMLQRIEPDQRLQALCLVPTRELAMQVMEEIKRAARYSGRHALAVYGGQRVGIQLRALEKNPQFIVGTPGRLMDFMQRGAIRTQDLSCVALDEVDRMLDIGFREDIRRILSKVHGKHQTVFTSATIDNEIKRLIERHTHDPVWIDVSRDQITVTEVDQSYVTCGRDEKFAALLCVLRQEKPDLAIIFTNTKGAARRVARRLDERGFKAAEIHGDLLQRQRESVMRKFRDQHIHLLIATDLASRGIDVNDITHIINYDLPVDPEVYVHRIGRTARMGKAGKAITLVTREEGKELTAIEMLTNIEIPRAQIKGYSPAPERQPEKEAATATAVAEPARPRSLGANFKPMRRRRRL